MCEVLIEMIFLQKYSIDIMIFIFNVEINKITNFKNKRCNSGSKLLNQLLVMDVISHRWINDIGIVE